ncbi:hypothetical protein BASA81_010375 [Batrachochytrium salamandrivorans]|nr:hypothetical protein BASA81_010375 [Batrachochytrium salamandrivorans]
MSFDWGLGAVAAVGLAAYLMRRHVVFVPPKPSRLASREQLARWLQTNNNKDIEICLLPDTKEAHKEEELVNTRGFLDYLMFAWWFEAAPKLKRAQRFPVIHAVSRIVRCNAQDSGGFVAVAKRQGKIIASIRVAIQIRGQKDSDLALVWKFINGSVYFPVSILPQTSARFFQRLFGSLEHLDGARETVSKDFASGDKYLHLIQIATDPEAQGSGAGGELLQAVGRVADQLGLPVYLETDTERLRAFYERNGFQVKITYVIPDPEDPFLVNFGMVRPLQ